MSALRLLPVNEQDHGVGSLVDRDAMGSLEWVYYGERVPLLFEFLHLEEC